MAEPRAQVRNAADPDQVKRARRKEQHRDELLAAALKQVLSTPAGRIVCWELLARAGVYQSVWRPTVEVHYLAGRQDYGHELLGLLIAADEDLYQVMEREARARAKRDDAETDAAHTPRAGQQGEDR